MKLTIPIPEKVSLNRIYAGVHFRERSRHKDAYRMAVMCVPGLKPYDGSYPIHIHYHYRLSGTQLDIDNHSYMGKLVLDSLVDAGVVLGDQPKYVSGITITASKAKKGEYDEVDVELLPFPTSCRGR